MKKHTSKLLAVVMAVITLIGLFTVSEVATAASKNPWDNYPEPTKAIYYKTPTMKGNDVRWVQVALNTTINAGLSIDGSFGPACKNATKKFQKKYKLSQDGSFGPATRSKMVSVLNGMGYYKSPQNNQTTQADLIWPLVNGKGSVTCVAGSKRGANKHVGTDIGASTGTAILAVTSGYVVDVDQTGARGYYITIRHGKYIATYEHMKQQAVVKKGSYVSQGQVIGYVGNTGHSTGSHLHFEIVVESTLSKKSKLVECLYSDVNNRHLKPTYYSVSKGSKVGSYYKLNLKQV